MVQTYISHIYSTCNNVMSCFCFQCLCTYCISHFSLSPLTHLHLCSHTDSGKTLTFFNYNYKGDFQTVTFEGNEIKKIFHGSFHKVSLFFSGKNFSVVNFLTLFFIFVIGNILFHIILLGRDF